MKLHSSQLGTHVYLHHNDFVIENIVWYGIKDMTLSVYLRAGGRGGSVVECRTPEREVGGSKPTTAVLCP